MERKKDKIA